MTATTTTTETCRECGTTDARHHWMLDGHHWWICDECETHGAGQPYRRCLQPPTTTESIRGHGGLLRRFVACGDTDTQEAFYRVDVDAGDSEIHLIYSHWDNGRRKETTFVVTEILEEDIDVRPS